MLIDLEKLKEKYNLAVNGVLHVGAHHGEEAPFYYKMGWGPVWWVEAETDSFQVLERVISNYPNQFGVQACVSDEPKVVTFHHANNGQSSSMLEFGTHSVEHPDVVFTETHSMMATTIDELFDFEIIGEGNFLNLDIQGAELLALIGGLHYLEHVDYVYTEVNQKELYKGCVQLPELDRWLASCGFQRVEIDMTPHGWGDALYIRRALL